MPNNLKKRLQAHIMILIEAFNHNLKQPRIDEYWVSYNNFLSTEIEMLKNILEEENAK